MTGQILAVIPWAALVLPILLGLRGAASDPARQHRTVPIRVDRRPIAPRKGR